MRAHGIPCVCIRLKKFTQIFRYVISRLCFSAFIDVSKDVEIDDVFNFNIVEM